MMRRILRVAYLGLVLAVSTLAPTLARAFEVHEGDARIANFRLALGDTLPELRMHYRALGTLQRDAHGHATNVVLILHGTGGSGANFLAGRGGELFAAELFGPGQPLDVQRYFIVMPDSIGHGKSSKPSDGLRAHFPTYGYRDAVEAQYRLLKEGLGIDHLRLVVGTSMGGMHTWLWAERHPDFSDAFMPMACLPAQISGRNRMWRRIMIDAIRRDPSWEGGEYKQQPAGLRPALQTLALMVSNPVLRQQQAPTLGAADQMIDDETEKSLASMDANDLLYAVQSSYDYDPAPELEKISAPLLAINTADDLINPPELGILERQIGHVAHGRAIVIPADDRTIGHGTYIKAAVWKSYLVDFLAQNGAGQAAAGAQSAPAPAAAAAPGQNTAPAAPTVEAPHAAKRNPNDVLESEVRRALSANEHVFSKHVDIKAKAGTVFLSGWVESTQDERVVVGIARSVPGVQQVVDDMEVKDYFPH